LAPYKPPPYVTYFTLGGLANAMAMRTTRNGLFRYYEDSSLPDEIALRELSEEETELVMRQVMRVHELAEQYLPGQSELGFSPKVLDAIFMLWLGDAKRDRPDEETVALVLGSAFGYYLREAKQMQWRVAKAKGEEPTLAVSSEAYGLTIYPIASVQKRIESRSAGFFEPIAAVIEDKLRDLQQ
jgi:hypothetical protein